MGLLSAHFLIAPTWTPQELDKMRQISVMRTRIECPSNLGLRFRVMRLVFSTFWNEVTKTGKFKKIAILR